MLFSYPPLVAKDSPMTEPLETPGAGASVVESESTGNRTRRPTGRASARPQTDLTERHRRRAARMRAAASAAGVAADDPSAIDDASFAAVPRMAMTGAVAEPAVDLPVTRGPRTKRTTDTELGLATLLLRACRAWVRRHARSLPLVLGLLLIATALIGTGITRYPSFADDEGTYVAEAWAFISHGQLSHYTYWYDHPPLAWVQMGVLTWIFGGLVKGATAVATARTLMLIPALITTGLLYILARRLQIRRGFAVLAVLTLICSPLGVVSLREIYLENFAMPWLLASFILAASPRRRLSAFAGSGACFAAAVLCKETFLLYLPGVLLANYYHADRRTRSFCITGFFAAFILIALAYPLYALLKGELLPGPGHVSLEQAVVWQLFTRQATGSVFSPSSAAHHLVVTWLDVDPWLLGLGVISIVPALFVRRLRPIAFGLGCCIVIAVHGGYLPEPFDIGLLALLALLPAGLLDSLWGSPTHVSEQDDDERSRASNHAEDRPERDDRQQPRVYRTRARRAKDWIRPASALAITAILAAVITPSWVSGDTLATTATATGPQVQAEHWIEAHVPRKDRVLIDDTMYVDLVRAGFTPRYGVVWFYKLGFGNNLDPAVMRHLPHGWKQFDYVVDSPVIRSALQQDPGGYPQVQDAITHSTPVASFGSQTGGSVIQIRKVQSTGFNGSAS